MGKIKIIEDIGSFTLSDTYISTIDGFPNDKNDHMLHNHFKISVVKHRREDPDILITFDFYGSQHDHDKGKTDLNRTDLIGAFSCFLEDSISGTQSFKEFCSEYGYDEDSMRAFKIYQQCQEQLEKAKKIGLNEHSLYVLVNKLREKYNL